MLFKYEFSAYTMHMKQHTKNDKLTWYFGILAALAIIFGGCVAAFSAHAPTQPLVWASAYLVLIVGVAQAALVYSLRSLANTSPAHQVAIAFSTYNLGNLGVLGGTLTNTLWVVNTGGALLVVSLLICIYVVRKSPRSWLLWVFYLVVTTLLISIPIGLFLATR